MQANYKLHRLAYLRPVEIITVGYWLLLSLLIVFFHRNLPQWRLYVLLHISGALAVVCLAKFTHRSGKKWVIYLRDWYLAFLFIPMFEEMDLFVPALSHGWVNQTLISADYLIFGTHPSVWLERIANPWLTEYLMFCFSTVYFIPYLFGAIVYFKSGRERYQDLLLSIALGFYICYITFLLFPAQGPWVTMKDLYTVRLNGWIFTRLVNIIEAAGSVRGAAFPSSHVMISFVVLLFARRYSRTAYAIFLPIILGLFFATVYCRFHYVVDVMGGLIVGGISFWLAPKLNRGWKLLVQGLG